MSKHIDDKDHFMGVLKQTMSTLLDFRAGNAPPPLLAMIQGVSLLMLVDSMLTETITDLWDAKRDLSTK